jgi:hypothetical protein
VKRKNIHRVIIVACLLISGIRAFGQFTSVFNKAVGNFKSDSISFIVSGHFHGSSSNQSTFPAATLLAGIDTINSLKPVFLISLGDLFLDVNDVYISHYKKSLFDKLQMPIYNAVGNHDLSNGNLYEKIYGDTYYKLSINDNLFIVLNTEMDDGSIKGAQLYFLKNLLENTAPMFRNIFVFSHRPVWAENNERYKRLFAGNTRTIVGKNNFEEEIKPLFSSLAKTKNICWMSGSLAGGPASFFYDKEPGTNITFIQTAIRDLPRDAVLQVNIINSEVSFKGVSLTGQQLKKIEDYTIEFWEKTVPSEEKFSFRLLPYMLTQMLLHYYFWFGFLFCLIFTLLLRYIVRKWKRKK